MNMETARESMGYRPNYTEILTHDNFYETYKKISWTIYASCFVSMHFSTLTF